MNRKAASGFLFVALASFALSAVALQQPSLAQGWHHIQMTDPYRGAFTRFSLTGKFLKTPPADAYNRPSLAVDCSTYNRSHKSKFVRGTLVVGDPLKIDWIEPEQIETMSYFPEVSVRYRLDDAKEDQENWTPSANKKSASFSKASLEKMLRAHTIEITTHDNDGAQIVMQFDMPDPTLIEQGCDVDEHKK